MWKISKNFTKKLTEKPFTSYPLWYIIIVNMQNGINTSGVNLGARLRLARERYGWTQTQLADLSGITQAQVSRIESEANNDPSISQVMGLAQALRIPLEVLLGDQNVFSRTVVRVSHEEDVVNVKNIGGLYKDEKELHEIRKHFNAMASPRLRRDLEEWAEKKINILIVGAPGRGKNTFLKGLTDYLLHNDALGVKSTRMMQQPNSASEELNWLGDEKIGRLIIDELPNSRQAQKGTVSIPARIAVPASNQKMSRQQIIATMEAEDLEEAIVSIYESCGEDTELSLNAFGVVIELGQSSTTLSGEEALATLSQRSRSVIQWRLGLDGGEELSLEMIARKLGVTRERVRAIEARALCELCPLAVSALDPSDQAILRNRFDIGGEPDVKTVVDVKTVAAEMRMTPTQVQNEEAQVLAKLRWAASELLRGDTFVSSFGPSEKKIAQLTRDARGKVASPLLWARRDNGNLMRYSGLIECAPPKAQIQASVGGQPLIVGFTSAQDGVGEKTTTAIAYAKALAHKFAGEGRVLLLDGDFSNSRMAFFLDDQAPPDILDLLRYTLDQPEINSLEGISPFVRNYDGEYPGLHPEWEKLIGGNAKNLDVLFSPGLLDANDQMSDEDLNNVMVVLTRFYSAIVIDIGTSLKERCAQAWLAFSQQVYLLADDERASLLLLQQYAQRAENMSLVSPERFRFLLTHDQGSGLAPKIFPRISAEKSYVLPEPDNSNYSQVVGRMADESLECYSFSLRKKRAVVGSPAANLEMCPAEFLQDLQGWVDNKTIVVSGPTSS